MIGIRLVFTYDAKPFAEALTRLLEAEQHLVRLTYGRQSLVELEDARSETDAVVLVWSPDARSQTYMMEWGNKIPPARLVEIARAPDCPRIARKAPVIDFMTWRGERGGRAWDALNDRLRVVSQTLNPPKPASKPAIAAMAAVAVAAVFGGIAERGRAVSEHAPDPAREDVASIATGGSEVGGPIIAVEPASVEDLAVHFGPFPQHLQPLSTIPDLHLVALDDFETPHIRDETLLERLADFNPLRRILSAQPAPEPTPASVEVQQ